jgi:hypothetical protein
MKFKLKEDWNYETTFLGKTVSKSLYKEGHIFELNPDNKYEIIQPTGEIITLSESEMEKIPFLEKLVEKIDDFEIIIEEIPEDDDNLVRNWRIQLDVKTTRKKLKEVQRIIEDQVKPILIN